MNKTTEKSNLVKGTSSKVPQNLSASSDETAPIVQKMRILVSKFEYSLEKLLKNQVVIKKTKEKTWKNFSLLPTTMQEGIANGLEAQVQFIQNAVHLSLDAFNELGMLDYALNTLSFISNPEVTEKIQKNDIIEILDDENLQVYRSYSCFALCNYSILELATYPWYELYGRSKVVTGDLMDGVKALMTGRSSLIKLDNLSEYTVQELKTEERSTFAIRERFLAKMRCSKNGRIYVLSVKKIRVLPSLGEIKFI